MVCMSKKFALQDIPELQRYLMQIRKTKQNNKRNVCRVDPSGTGIPPSISLMLRSTSSSARSVFVPEVHSVGLVRPLTSGAPRCRC